jgi:hypothetical protein
MFIYDVYSSQTALDYLWSYNPKLYGITRKYYSYLNKYRKTFVCD